MAHSSSSAPRENLPTVAHGMGEETAAGPQTDNTVTKADFIPVQLEHFKVLQKLGQGGMGWVLLAEDTRLTRRVALKVMRGKYTQDKDSRERFLREARLAAGLKHDHIVTVYHVGEDRGIPYLAMEFLEGGTLQQRLEYPKPLSLGAAVRIAREIAEGLKAAHERGMIHRDIKPANIWLESPKGRVKILDFGLARHLETASGLTQAGEIVGTPHYMAPEQARNKNLDPRTDLYSLGCVLYRMVTGRLPFAGETLVATLTAIAVDSPTPVRELNPHVPPALADLIHKLLAKDPADRHASAAALIDELSLIEQDVSGGARSSVSIPVPPVIQINTEPKTIAERPKSGKVAPLAARKSAATERLWMYAAIGGIVLLTAMLVIVVWLAMMGVFTPSGTSTTDRKAPAGKAGANLRSVEPLGPKSAAAAREMAQWALAQSSSQTEVQVRAKDQNIRLGRGDQLPREDFTLEAVRLRGCRDLALVDLKKLAAISTLRSLDLSESNIDDSGLTALAQLPALTTLEVEDTAVGDAGVQAVIAKSPMLEVLRIGGTQCTTAVLPAVAKLKDLTDLSLRGLPLADADLATLRPNVHLRTLDLSQTSIGDDGIPHLVNMPVLENLILDRTNVTAAGIGKLGEQGRPVTLSLRSTKIGDAGAGQFLKCIYLVSLTIDMQSDLQDAGLAQLQQVPTLKKLEASSGQFSMEAIKRFQEARPDCNLVLR
ncbi:MAG: protein kinase [Pirellulaceae bacterium]|nr:protein kinase [Pirellulaceae bacterium]